MNSRGGGGGKKMYWVGQKVNAGFSVRAYGKT